MSMEVHKYTMTLMDPFGADICSMSFYSYTADDPYADWFMPFLLRRRDFAPDEEPEYDTEYRAHVVNPRNAAMGFSLRLERQ